MIIPATIYRLGLSAYFGVVRIAARFNGKAKLFVEGRRGLLSHISERLKGETRPRIWMHCASLGEFEQGRPVLDALRQQYPAYAIVLTFFSPSGYEVRKNYEGADYVFYLPQDTPGNARHFMDSVNPALCIFVKYEFWYYHLHEIAKRHIPALLISAIFSQQQGFFKWYGGLQRRMLGSFSHIFVQDKQSAALLQRINVNNITIGGDTRFDRVVKAAEQIQQLDIAAAFCASHKIIVAGSTWRSDEVFLEKVMKLLPADWKLILVPHEVNEAHLQQIEKLFEDNIVRLSRAANNIASNCRVLMVDRIGLLLQLYRYGRVAWIGGAFDKDGVHNVLEAAVFARPCFYGPTYQQYKEAVELVESGGAMTVSLPEDFAISLGELDDEIRYDHHANAARTYVYANCGATQKIMDYTAGIITA